MSTQIVLTLPDAVLEKAASWANMVGRPVGDFLAETVELSINPLGTETKTPALETWSDEEVLNAADATLPLELDRRLSDLLQQQQAGALIDGDRTELQTLMQMYQGQLLRKACALREAVRRRLREPLQS
jgi:hypothetical protein